MSNESLDPQLTALEAGLRALTPGAAGISRDRLLFLAGQASARHRAVRWRFLAAGMAVAAAVMAVFLLRLPREPAVIEIVRWLPMPASAKSSDEQTPLDSVVAQRSPQFEEQNEPFAQTQLRKLVFRHGVDALPRFPDMESEENSSPSNTTPPLKAGSQSLWSAHP